MTGQGSGAVRWTKWLRPLFPSAYMRVPACGRAAAGALATSTLQRRPVLTQPLLSGRPSRRKAGLPLKETCGPPGSLSAACPGGQRPVGEAP